MELENWTNASPIPNQSLPSVKDAGFAFLAAALAGVAMAVTIGSESIPPSLDPFLQIIEKIGVFFTFLGTLCSGYDAFWSKRKVLWGSWLEEEKRILDSMQARMIALHPGREKFLLVQEIESRRPSLESGLSMLRKFDSTINQVAKWGVVFVGFGVTLILAV